MSEENKSRLEGAIEQLRNHQTQLDADGIMVGVSREALDMALAALSAPKAEAVAVKPLVWEECGGDWFAHSLVGQYGVGIVQGSYIATLRSIDDTGRWDDEVFARGIGRAGDGIGLPKAKAAAQADYEARILSAIDTSPVPKVETMEPTHWAVYSKTGVHIGLWRSKMVAEQAAEDYPEAIIIPLYTSPVPALTDEAISAVWTAAMTAACNIVIKRQNDLNDDDGPCDILNEQGEIISAIKEWLAPDTTYLNELRSMMPVTALTDEAVERAVEALCAMDIGDPLRAGKPVLETAMRRALLAALPSKGEGE